MRSRRSLKLSHTQTQGGGHNECVFNVQVHLLMYSLHMLVEKMKPFKDYQCSDI